MNDPCGVGYDPCKKKYHLFYQWNAKGCAWGNISWGHMTSQDLLRWKRNGTEPVIEASKHSGEGHEYDKEAIFTGCLVPTGPCGEKDQLTAIYTSVAEIPFHWSTPYPRGAAGLAATVSLDGGKTWNKHPENPFVVEEPPGITVTGFRDPYVDQWPYIDELLGEEIGSNKYGLMSGGIVDECATVFLYQISPSNLLDWKYLGPLIKAELAFRPSQKWTGDSGVNWECTNFMTLTSRSGVQRDFLLTGTEGGQDRDHITPTSNAVGSQVNDKTKLPERVPRWTLWLCAKARNCSTPGHRRIEMDYNFGGIFDHGVAYAPNSFQDPSTGKRVVWSWLIEEDVPIDYCEDKGWTGCLSLPREVFLYEIDHVVSGFKSSLDELRYTFEIETSAKGYHTARTLGVRPLQDLENLRLGAPTAHIDKSCKLSLPLLDSDTQSILSSTDIPVPGTRWELNAFIRILPICESVGFTIFHGAAANMSTEIIFHPQKEEIVVKRPKPKTSEYPVNDREERGPHTLFRYSNGEIERLKLRIFRDGQVLEVYANDRFALATMIYAGDEHHGEAEGIETFVSAFATAVKGDSPDSSAAVESAALFEDIKIYEMVEGIISTSV